MQFEDQEQTKIDLDQDHEQGGGNHDVIELSLNSASRFGPRFLNVYFSVHNTDFLSVIL
jgi:hypothetical protein